MGVNTHVAVRNGFIFAFLILSMTHDEEIQKLALVKQKKINHANDTGTALPVAIESR